MTTTTHIITRDPRTIQERLRDIQENLEQGLDRAQQLERQGIESSAYSATIISAAFSLDALREALMSREGATP